MFHTFCHTYTYLSTIQIQNTLVSPIQKMTKKGFGLASDLFDTLSMHGFDNIACFLGLFWLKVHYETLKEDQKGFWMKWIKILAGMYSVYSYTSRRKKPCYIRIQDSDYGVSLF